MENNEHLRIKIRQQELTIEQLTRECDEAKTKHILNGTEPEKSGADVRGWKSAVVTRMYEGKMNALEEELSKKVDL